MGVELERRPEIPGSPDAARRTREFLAIASEFRLGALTTEQFHPLTENLSQLSQRDPSKALKILHAIDAQALNVLLENAASVRLLATRIKDTLDAGRSVLLTGCGSTGRLSLTCESLWRREMAGTPMEDRVKSFMAGGDIAMVRSIESFEDRPDYGERQLEESGFADGDLLIGSSEGGETPFVIGATLRAAEISSNPPFFLYCNPDNLLRKAAKRSEQILSHPHIGKINLTVGPMALSGSTRMQASTVLMAAVGFALLAYPDPASVLSSMETLVSFWQRLDPSFLSGFIIEEATLYKEGGYLLYESDADLAITILTDTTERAPTFSMLPFENEVGRPAKPSLCYLSIPGTADSASAWKQLLVRPPRALSWEHIRSVASHATLLGFDFSSRCRDRRLSDLAPASHQVFALKHVPEGISFACGDQMHLLPTGGLPLLPVHLVLKMLLNMHSTLVMGRLGRFDGNVMTWVKANNNKLIDRTIRYAEHLLKKQGMRVDYGDIASACFHLMEQVPSDRSLVHAVVGHFQAGKG